jgi:hypothetical protein
MTDGHNLHGGVLPDPKLARAGTNPRREARVAIDGQRRWTREIMKTTILTTALLFSLAGSLQAKDKPAYEKGHLLQMDSSSCGYSEKDGKTLAGQLIGTDGQHKKTQEVLCQEYVLQGTRVTYRIRPKDDKHPVLLPVGETAEFRIHKDKLILRVPEMDEKEREYIVLSMTQRAEITPVRAAASPAADRP